MLVVAYYYVERTFSHGFSSEGTLIHHEQPTNCTINIFCAWMFKYICNKNIFWKSCSKGTNITFKYMLTDKSSKLDVPWAQYQGNSSTWGVVTFQSQCNQPSARFSETENKLLALLYHKRKVQHRLQVAFVRNRTLTLIEREDDTRSWENFLVYFSHSTTMSCPLRGWGYILIGC
jgi:hypothetical protein